MRNAWVRAQSTLTSNSRGSTAPCEFPPFEASGPCNADRVAPACIAKSRYCWYSPSPTARVSDVHDYVIYETGKLVKSIRVLDLCEAAQQTRTIIDLTAALSPGPAMAEKINTNSCRCGANRGRPWGRCVRIRTPGLHGGALHRTPRPITKHADKPGQAIVWGEWKVRVRPQRRRVPNRNNLP